MKYLPWMVYNGEESTKAFQDAVGVLTGEAWEDLYDFMNQVRLSTCSWSIRRFEREYSILPLSDKPLDQRVALVRAKRRRKGTTTREVMKAVAGAFFDGEVQVVEHSAEYMIELRLVESEGITPIYWDLYEVLYEIIPAHLGLGLAAFYGFDARIYAGVSNPSQAYADLGLDAGDTQEQLPRTAYALTLAQWGTAIDVPLELSMAGDTALEVGVRTRFDSYHYVKIGGIENNGDV